MTSYSQFISYLQPFFLLKDHIHKVFGITNIPHHTGRMWHKVRLIGVRWIITYVKGKQENNERTNRKKEKRKKKERTWKVIRKNERGSQNLKRTTFFLCKTKKLSFNTHCPFLMRNNLQFMEIINFVPWEKIKLRTVWLKIEKAPIKGFRFERWKVKKF